MKNTLSNKRKAMPFYEARRVIKREAEEAWLKWTEEIDDQFTSEIEFLLGLKGRWLLCHMGKNIPYTLRFRLIWEKDYTRCQPWNFVKLAKQKLLH